jgi:hypothetical protein
MSSTPHKLVSRDQRASFELFQKRHERREVPHVAWLDALAMADIEANEKEHIPTNQVDFYAQCRWSHVIGSR